MTRSFGIGVITPRWLYVLAAATPAEYGDPVITDETLEQIQPELIQRGDIVGIGIHTGNALRGMEVGRMARERGAWVIYGGIHATLYPEEARDLGGAHAVVKGDGDVVWAKVIADLVRGTAQADLRRRTDFGRTIPPRALGSRAAQSLYVGLRANRARLPEALFLLFGVAHRRAEAAAARVGRGDRRDRAVAASRISLHRAGRR